ncbi:MAG TPA: tetratricopeptide repeat protein [Frankiaceae bacterium]|nr:tetratricopeptide repeat protein [Frankiaceae bacterium]
MTKSDDLLDEADDAIERGDVDAAVVLLERAMALGSRDAAFNLGNVEYARGRYDRAAELHRRAFESGDAEALMNLATDLLALRRWEEARDRFREVLDAVGDERALLGLAEALEELGDREGAIAALRRAVEARVDEAAWLLAGALARQGEVREAHDLWASAAADDPEALVNRGAFYRDQGEYERAKADLLAALERGATSAHLYLASTYRRQGAAGPAERHYRLAIESGHERDGFHDLGGLYEELGRTADAADAYARAAALGSACAEEHRRALSRDGATDEAARNGETP